MVEKHGRFGRKNGKGFYDYPQGQPKRLWPGLADLLPKKLTRDEVEAIDVEELKQRFLVVQAVEAARTFEEKVVTDVREADVGSILGWGFAPFSGGTLSYIDMMGAKKFVALARKFEKKYGARFAPPKLLDRHGGQATTPSTAASRRRGRRKGGVVPSPRVRGEGGERAQAAIPVSGPRRRARPRRPLTRRPRFARTSTSPRKRGEVSKE